MSELIKTDIGDFFVKHTKNFEKEPPDSMWENIESQVPQYSVSTVNNSLLKYLVSGIGLSIIIIAAILFYFQVNQNKTEQSFINQKNVNNPNSKQIVDNKIDYTDKKSTLSSIPENTNTTIATKQNSNIKINKNNLNKPITNNVASEEPKKTMKYSINAATYKNINEIIFENGKKENVIILKNPVPNAFGFYEIDISKLSSGTYNIWIITNENKTLHKTETFN